MPQVNINNSPNISVLDIAIIADIPTKSFLLNLSPSLFIGSGELNMLGAKVAITNPYGIEIKTIGSGYDIASPFTNDFEFDMPLEGDTVQYGGYKFHVEIFDADGTKYSITKEFSICEPDAKNKSKKFSTLNAEIKGNCQQGKVFVSIGEPATYKGNLAQGFNGSFELNYPTASGLPTLQTNNKSFIVTLFEGVYKVIGMGDVSYLLGDNVTVIVPYKLNCEKKILCIVDLCCVYGKLEQLNLKLTDDCSDKDKSQITDIIFDSLRLLKTIELGASCGEDVSPYIEELENLLGCSCTCSANEGVPIVNNTPTSNVSIEGCNVSAQVVGLSTVYTINNYEYIVTVNPANNFVTISNPTLSGCVKTQQLNFNIGQLYNAIKGQVNTTQEYNFWAGVVNNVLANITPELATCFGITAIQWAALTFAEKFFLLMEKMCNCCSNSVCNAIISNIDFGSNGNDVILSWTNVGNVDSVDVYVDGVFFTNVLAPIQTCIVSDVFGAKKDYSLIAKCVNGINGNRLQGEYTATPCPMILPPSLSDNTITDAECPFDLTTLAPAAPMGFEIEWHNQNNKSNTSLVPNPAAVTSGTYFAFMVQQSSNCSSVSSQVIVTCAVAGNCTEPLNILVQEAVGGTNLVTFNSASTPPPSYLVKRKLATDPDVSGSYTTLGTPTFNVGLNKWTFNDTTAMSNTLYTYKVESQCSDGSRPSSLFEYARIVCPSVLLESTDTKVTYSFINSGGQIDKYLVELFDATGTVFISSQTVNTPFLPLIKGNFTGLSIFTAYRVRVTTFIGTYFKVCDTQSINTKEQNVFVRKNNTMSGVDSTFEVYVGGDLVATGTLSDVGELGFYSDLVPMTGQDLNLKILTGTLSSAIATTQAGIVPPDTLVGLDATWNGVIIGEVSIQFNI